MDFELGHFKSYILFYLSPVGRRDRYEKNLWRYYVEQEWSGELAREVRSDHSRSLTMNQMDADDFEDNGEFGDHRNTMSSESEGVVDSDSDVSLSSGRRHSKHGGKSKDVGKPSDKRAKPRKTLKNDGPIAEEPLEDPVLVLSGF